MDSPTIMVEEEPPPEHETTTVPPLDLTFAEDSLGGKGIASSQEEHVAQMKMSLPQRKKSLDKQLDVVVETLQRVLKGVDRTIEECSSSIPQEKDKSDSTTAIEQKSKEEGDMLPHLERGLRTSKKLLEIATTIQKSTIEELQRTSQNHIQDIQAMVRGCSHSDIDALRAVRESVTTLLFVFAPFSRFVEYLEFRSTLKEPVIEASPKVPVGRTLPYTRKRGSEADIHFEKSGSDDDILEGNRLRLPSKGKGHHRRPSYGRSLSSSSIPVYTSRLDDSSSSLDGTELDQSISENPVLPRETPSNKKGIFGRVTQRVLSMVRRKEMPPTTTPMGTSSTMMCRICEEVVPAEDLEAHSKICAITTEAEVRQQNFEVRLRKLIKAIDARRARGQTLPASALQDVQQLMEAAMEAATLSYERGDSIDKAGLIVEKTSRICKRFRKVKKSKSAQIYALSQLASRVVNVVKEKRKALTEYKSKVKSSGSIATIRRKSTSGNKEEEESVVHVPSIDDFEIIKPISHGAFGRVFLARKKRTGDLYAIKVLKKSDMIRKNLVSHVQAERKIMTLTDNPFVVRLYYSFQSLEYLYMVMEYEIGGDCYSLLQQVGCFSEDMARMLLAEALLALEYLHKNSIVHRDIKPDNLLVNRHGHLVLTDFGLSRMGLVHWDDDMLGIDIAPETDRRSGTVAWSGDSSSSSGSWSSGSRKSRDSLVGTPDYLAPEILLGMGHGREADYWALGCIMFEFLTGAPPFNDETPQLIFDNILNLRVPWPQVPEEMSFAAQDLIERLLTIKRTDRLGHGGAEEVKAHPFFRSINWGTLLQEPGMWVPEPLDSLDTSYFGGSRGGKMGSINKYFPKEDEKKQEEGSPREDVEYWGEFEFLNPQFLGEKNRTLLSADVNSESMMSTSSTSSAKVELDQPLPPPASVLPSTPREEEEEENVVDLPKLTIASPEGVRIPVVNEGE